MMTKDYRRVDYEAMREVLLAELGFFRGIVETGTHWALKAKMAEHIAAPSPMSGAGLVPGTATALSRRIEDQGIHLKLWRPKTSKGNLLHAAILSISRST